MNVIIFIVMVVVMVITTYSNDFLQARANVKNNKYKDDWLVTTQGFCTCHRRYVRSDPR